MRILEYPNDLEQLRLPTFHVKKEDWLQEDFQIKLKAMLEILKSEKDGLGLAASQVLWNKEGTGAPKLFILNCDKNIKKMNKEKIFINPEIIKISDLKDIKEEGCISFKGLNLEVERSLEVEFKYMDENFEEHFEIVGGFYARVILHENDHLISRLFIDRVDIKQFAKVNNWLKARK